MKQKIIFTIIIALALSSQLVSAGSITDTYTKGDTLTATKMDNIKTAVNDNDSNVSTNAENITINADVITTSADRITENEIAVSGLPGVNVSYSPSFVSLPSGPNTVAQIVVTSPADGYVLVQYSGVVSITHTNGTRDMVRVEIMDTEAPISNGPSFNVVQVAGVQPSSGDIYYSSMKTQRLFPVMANSTNTFYVRADLLGGTTASIGYNYMSAIFMPTTIGTLPLLY